MFSFICLGLFVGKTCVKVPYVFSQFIFTHCPLTHPRSTKRPKRNCLPYVHHPARTSNESTPYNALSILIFSSIFCIKPTPSLVTCPSSRSRRKGDKMAPEPSLKSQIHLLRHVCSSALRMLTCSRKSVPILIHNWSVG